MLLINMDKRIEIIHMSTDKFRERVKRKETILFCPKVFRFINFII